MEELVHRIDELMRFIDGSGPRPKRRSRAGPGYLAGYERGILEALALRAKKIYMPTGTTQCARGMHETGTFAVSEEKQARYDEMFGAIANHAGWLDGAIERWTSPMNDFEFALGWEQYAAALAPRTAYRVLMDVVCHSGEVPPRTGVYVPADDQYGSLQFGWTGEPKGALPESCTFNDLGLAAVREFGHHRLWSDGERLIVFLQANIAHASLAQDSFLDLVSDASCTPCFLARHAFTTRPCKWYFVEPVGAS